jgi:uncharacterized membrane protein YqjE
MTKIVTFYLLCCLSIILIWLTTDDYDIESKDFKFGFNVLVLATCTVYAPIYTISACLLYYSKVNKAILSDKWFCILYCIFPFLCFKILDIIGIWNDYRLEYSILIVFIIQNVIIIVKWLIQRRYKVIQSKEQESQEQQGQSKGQV